MFIGSISSNLLHSNRKRHRAMASEKTHVQLPTASYRRYGETDGPNSVQDPEADESQPS